MSPLESTLPAFLLTEPVLQIFTLIIFVASYQEVEVNPSRYGHFGRQLSVRSERVHRCKPHKLLSLTCRLHFRQKFRRLFIQSPKSFFLKFQKVFAQSSKYFCSKSQKT